MSEVAFDPQSVNCSRCGSGDRLNFVIMPYDDEGPGRVLVYCYRCRRSGHSERIDVSIPLPLVTAELMAACYLHGLTQSDPDTATRIVFGDDPAASETLELIQATKVKP